MAEQKHSTLRASASGRWMECPGSIRECAQIPPSPPGPYADEGTAAHKWGEVMLGATVEIPLKYQKWITPELKKHVQVYVDEVLRLAKGSAKKLFIEQKFSLEWLHPGMFGTNDACVAEAFGCLDVLDYKYGVGVVVEAEDNSQMMYYALGALKQICIDVETVRMTIVQPRAPHPDGPIRSCTKTVDELMAWGENVLAPAAKATEDPNAPLIAGPWCKNYFCPAITTCPAVSERAYELAGLDFDVIPEEITMPELDKMPPEKIAKLLAFFPIFSAWKKEVEAYAKEAMEKGTKVPGFKLVRGKSDRKYIDPVKTEQKLKPLYGNSIYEPTKLLGITKMEKLIGKEMMSEICYKPEAGVTIAPESDKREAVSSSAELDFKPI